MDKLEHLRLWPTSFGAVLHVLFLLFTNVRMYWFRFIVLYVLYMRSVVIGYLNCQYRKLKHIFSVWMWVVVVVVVTSGRSGCSRCAWGGKWGRTQSGSGVYSWVRLSYISLPIDSQSDLFWILLSLICLALKQGWLKISASTPVQTYKIVVSGQNPRKSEYRETYLSFRITYT